MASNLQTALAAFSLACAAFSVNGCKRPNSAFDEASDIFRVQCSGCHGPDGLATSPAPRNLGLRSLRSPEVLKMSDDELAEIVAQGSKNMPSYRKSLGDEKIRKIVAYLRHPLPRE